MTPNLILAFESSCDDTSVAIVDTNYDVKINLISSQPEHLEFGGVLPELASRLHLKNILYLTRQALNKADICMTDISAIAVSINPGLIGSLIVGLAFAKSLAWSLSKPLITVNHMLSHIFANYIENPQIKPPFLALVVSGGHTELVHFYDFTHFEVIGKTLDDAAGETFDKTAKLLGLGFPGGPIIDRLARTGNPAFVDFPRGMNRKGNFDFSYSGMKTAVLNYLARHEKAFVEENKSDIAASIQQAIVDPLINKSLAYARAHHLSSILLAGGVAANSALRSQSAEKAAKYGIRIYAPSLKLCMDNAAMVAAAAIPKFLNGDFSPLSVNAFSAKGTKQL
ncbi:MAG: tRNA (adenosine(37)-N6)-threonylcarbamoyltransferase complex transferase subunit TsaD [Candidatus Cloacimonadaceae bacterium]|nr:tRNA (adenosine(37)-N6)-threonylcarbamoyltransferase complex transferase subunit TsaD [Candidatus Cloacimonadaceae bacterium]MDP3114924.1 tRNA (adenosine(37)-N6)-threonylcarbamoyltransferase complex transferase subunit TsaD [Candidatus Cloacimonadaceae bacterium]